MEVRPIAGRLARGLVVEEHYLHRWPQVRFAYGLFIADALVGVVTFGNPMKSTRLSICPSDPFKVIELNRLWVDDEWGGERNTESWFVSRALKLLPPFIVVSYADTAQGHEGYIYRALNFRYAGRTDDKRKLYDYLPVAAGVKHSKGIKWGSEGTVKVERSPKHKYWTVTGNRTERHALLPLVTWPSLKWN